MIVDIVKFMLYKFHLQLVEDIKQTFNIRILLWYFFMILLLTIYMVSHYIYSILKIKCKW